MFKHVVVCLTFSREFSLLFIYDVILISSTRTKEIKFGQEGGAQTYFTGGIYIYIYGNFQKRGGGKMAPKGVFINLAQYMEPNELKTCPNEPILYTITVSGRLNGFSTILDFFGSVSPPGYPLKFETCSKPAIFDIFVEKKITAN